MNKTDLHRYARLNLVHEIEAAIAEGLDLNHKDSFGATPLHYAIAEKKDNVIRLLLEHGADVTAQDNNGSTPLHYAIEHNLYSVAEALLRKNPAAVLVADKYGNQPLWTAAFKAKGDYGLVRLLLQYGADPSHRNNVNLSPLDIPRQKRDDTLLRILESEEKRGRESFPDK